MKEFLCGDTIKVTWINSGVTPSDVRATIYNGSETAVDSATMVESGSGNGFFYHLHTVPNTPGFYVAETYATISGKPYKRRNTFKAIIGDSD